jgi:hypothetical protein
MELVARRLLSSTKEIQDLSVAPSLGFWLFQDFPPLTPLQVFVSIFPGRVYLSTLSRKWLSSGDTAAILSTSESTP